MECSVIFSVAVCPPWVILPGEFQGQRRESDTTERLTQRHTHTHTHTHTPQLHNCPSPTPMAFWTQSVNPGALPSWEATCLGSRRPVHTCPRLLACNYGLYLPARPPKLRHVSQSDSWLLPPCRQSSHSLRQHHTADKGFCGCQASSKARNGPDAAPSSPCVGQAQEEGRFAPWTSGCNLRPWSLGSQGRNCQWPLIPQGLIRTCSKFFFSQNCPFNIFGTGFREADLLNRYIGRTVIFPVKFLIKTNKQKCVSNVKKSCVLFVFKDLTFESRMFLSD